MKFAYDIILRPIITEQSMEQTGIKKYAFEVAPDANKIEIKKAVEEIFDVKVEKVTTLQQNLDQLIPGLVAVCLTLFCCRLLK